MAKKKEITVENKLRALYDLQLIDSRVDTIRSVRGELPLEVQDLEDEVAGLTTRLEKLTDSVDTLNDQIKMKKNLMEEAKFNSLTKETEFQDLEIQLAEKNIKEFLAKIEHKNVVIDEAKLKLSERKNHLKHKKSELNTILEETKKEEEVLLLKSEKCKKDIEERLVLAYSRIRNNVKNGLAVVAVERGASGGSYFTIPPQIIMEIGSRKKIITDEHSGRILVDEELAKEQKVKMEKVFAKI